METPSTYFVAATAGRRDDPSTALAGFAGPFAQDEAYAAARNLRAKLRGIEDVRVAVYLHKASPTCDLKYASNVGCNGGLRPAVRA